MQASTGLSIASARQGDEVRILRSRAEQAERHAPGIGMTGQLNHMRELAMQAAREIRETADLIESLEGDDLRAAYHVTDQDFGNGVPEADRGVLAEVRAKRAKAAAKPGKPKAA